MTPAISLWQPWASLITAGVKKHETRSWSAPKKYIGQRIAIHAAKTLKGCSDLDPALGRILLREFGPLWMKALPFGAVVGTAVLTSSAPMYVAQNGGRPASEDDEVCGAWLVGRFAWRLDDVKALPAPVPCKGRQGWFEVAL